MASWFELTLITEKADDKVFRLIPHVHKDNKTIYAIATTQNIELNMAEDIARKAFNNNFIITSDIDGIRQYEVILNIRPDEGQSTELRRAAVRNKLGMMLPFTWIFLTQLLESLFGPGKWFLEINLPNLLVEIDVETNVAGLYDQTMRDIRELIPANIKLISMDIKPYTHRYLNRHYTHKEMEQFTQGELSKYN